MTNEFSLSRRQLLSTSVALSVASFFGTSANVFATIEDVERVINEFAGSSAITEDKITLSIPDIAENGYIVPVSIVVDSPMSEDDYVQSVLILAEGNPLPEVATMHFTSLSGKAEGSTRMRLAQTQNVVAIAKMSDGSLYKDTRNVKVTISGCGG